MESFYIPYSKQFPTDIIRSDLYSLVQPMLDKIEYLNSISLGDLDDGYYEANVRVIQELDFEIPLTGLTLVLGQGDGNIKVSFNYYPETLLQINEFGEDEKRRFLALFEITVAKIRFPRTWLKPVIIDSEGNYIEDPDTTHYIELDVPFGFSVNEELNFDLLWPGGEVLPLSLPSAIIGDTGLIFSFSNLYFDISKSTNIPQANADGRANDFTGVYIDEAIVSLPKFWQKDASAPQSTAIIKANNLLIGTGGFSGTVGLEASNQGDLLHTQIGNLKIALDAFDIEFKNSGIVSSNIHGKLTVPGFKNEQNTADAIIDIDIHYDSNDFYVTASSTNTSLKIQIPDIFIFEVKSVSIGEKDGEFFIAASGSIDFTADVPGLGGVLPKGIDIKKIIIHQNGTIELEGGTIVLPKAATLKVGPAKLSVTALGFGSYEREHGGTLRKYKYVEFSAGISVNPGGVDARGDGIKVYFTVDNDLYGGLSALDIFVRIAGIGIDLVIPGNASKETAALLLDGYLSMKNPTPESSSNPDQPVAGSDAGTEYTGSVSFTLPKLKMGGSAGMRLNPKLPAFLVDIGLELSSPIPLGSTGLGIYGFRALVGERYVADREYIGLAPDAEWYQYYKKKIPADAPPREGVTINKFKEEHGFSFGAGVSLATTADEGKTFSSKLFFLLSLPDVFLLQGQAAILSKRIGLDDTSDPPFFALIAITDQSVEASFGVDYKLPTDSGNIVKVSGLIDMAYFFGNSSAWYVDIGKDTPAEKRVQAVIFSLFNSYFYLMINSGGIRAGAGASWSLQKNYGPVGLALGAYLDASGRISFHPEQFGASIDLGGYAKIKVFKFKFGFDVSASLSAEAYKPLIVTGAVDIKISLHKPFHDIKITVHFTWVISSTLHDEEVKILDIDSLAIQQPARAVNLLTAETYQLLIASGAPDSSLANQLGANSNDSSHDTYTIPLDSRIDIEFPKPVEPFTGDLFGGVNSFDNTDSISPQQAKSPKVVHQYKVTDVKIFSWDPTTSTWVDYNLYTADTPLQDAPFVDQSVLATLKSGYWQADHLPKYTKLSILAQSPISFLATGAGGNTPEEFGTGADDIFCPAKAIDKTCVNFDRLPLPVFPAGTLRFVKEKLLMRVLGHDGQVIQVTNPYQLSQALQLQPNSPLEIFFKEPVTTVDVTLSTKGAFVKLEYFARKELLASDGSAALDASSMTQYVYELVKSETIQANQLISPVEYNDINNPVDKIIIIGGACPSAQNIVCSQEVDPEAKLLFEFLNVLAINGDLVKQNLSFAGNSEYETKFCSTPLYTGTSTTCEVTYNATFGTTTLNATITDGQGYDCNFQLTLPTPDTQFDFSLIDKFNAIKVDNTDIVEGPRYTFIITAEYLAGPVKKTVDLQGVSDCWPISHCQVIDFLLREDAQGGSGYLTQEDDQPAAIRSRLILDEDESQSCSTIVFEVCWLSQHDQLINNTIPDLSDLQQQNQSMLDGINGSLQPVWRPDTFYAIKVSTEDKIIAPESLANDASHDITHDFTFGFRTRGTIGHYHTYKQEYKDLLLQDKEDQFKLASLKYYIDYTKSYPNADGNVLYAKPLFYKNPKLLLFYVRNYVYSMLNDWDQYQGGEGVNIVLESLIKDPAEPPVTNNVATIATAIAAQHTPNDTPNVSEEVSMLSNMLVNSTPCTGVTGPLVPIGVNSVFQMPDSFLKPLKLYTAIFNVKEKKYSDATYTTDKVAEVHRYNFQTSRYATFQEQVESYILDDSDPGNVQYAIFTIQQAFTATQIANAKAILDGTLADDDTLNRDYADKYERIIDGALQMGALQAAVTTEFNIVKDGTGNILGVLVRNPEPFNDPKLPDDILKQTLEMTVGPFQLNVFDVIFSRDRSKAFITYGLNVGAGQASFTFRYFEYDGTAYQVQDTRSVQIPLA